MATEKKGKPEIILVGCHWGGFRLIEKLELDSEVDFRAVRLMCGGRLSVGILLRAFETGADGVAILTCGEEECHYGFGAARGLEEFELARRMLRLLGIEDERLACYRVYPGELEKAEKDIEDFAGSVKKLDRLSILSPEG